MRAMKARLGLVAAALTCLARADGGALAGGCGSMAQPCTVPLGEYHAVAPPWREGGATRPVVVHFHGFGGSGAGVLEQRAMVDPIVARGYVVVAPTGLVRPGSAGRSWSSGSRPPIRDELAFLRQVLDDTAGRFHADRRRVLLTGFSAGAILVWKLACEAPPGEFTAFAPVAGSFWRPTPVGCAGPVRMLATQGWRDEAVPLEGEAPRADGRGALAGVSDSVEFWRRSDGCVGPAAATFATDGGFWRRSWSGCAPGTALELALHPGGHEVPAGWATLALDWFEMVAPPPRS